MVADDIFLHLANKGAIAKDWSLSKPKTEKDKERLREIGAAVLQAYKRDPEAFKGDIDAYVSANIVKWTGDVTRAAEKLARWVARSIAIDATDSQRRAYLAAGVSADFLLKAWADPQATPRVWSISPRIGPTAVKRLPEIVQWSTELITKMEVRNLTRLQDVIVAGLVDGHSVETIRKTLSTFKGFDADRASNVALDQTNKITNAILEANDSDLGVTEGIWIHVPGQYTSRQSHRHMDGKKFNLEKGMFDPEVNKYIKPSELYFCRCIYRPILPFEKF